MTVEDEVGLQLKNKVIKWLVIALLAVVSLGSLGFYLYKDQRDTEIRKANNDLAKLIPLQAVNDSLHYQIASMVPAEEIQKHLDKESQLAKTIKAQDQRILFLASASSESRVDSFPVLFVKVVGKPWMFDKSDKWFHVSGIADSMGLFFDDFQTRDSLTFAITQSREGILYGYIANHSPYNHIMNADFMIDSKQYYTPPWFRFDGVGIVGSVGSPGTNYLGVDVRATLWNQFEISPRFTTQDGVFKKSIEGRWRLPVF